MSSAFFAVSPVVTGSHIPFDRNGIKFYRADGEIDKADEQAILDTEVAVPDALSPSPLSAVDTAALDAYVARYTDFFGIGALAGTRVALYEHSSVARDVLRTVFEHLGAEAAGHAHLLDLFGGLDDNAHCCVFCVGAVKREGYRKRRAAANPGLAQGARAAMRSPLPWPSPAGRVSACVCALAALSAMQTA